MVFVLHCFIQEIGELPELEIIGVFEKIDIILISQQIKDFISTTYTEMEIIEILIHYDDDMDLEDEELVKSRSLEIIFDNVNQSILETESFKTKIDGSREPPRGRNRLIFTFESNQIFELYLNESTMLDEEMPAKSALRSGGYKSKSKSKSKHFLKYK
jgi:hypothetical protein